MYTFITWFFQSENQRRILERKEQLELETEKFGIAGGFSAVRDVTEHILPVFYKNLLTNLPPAQMLSVPNQLPARWDSYKSLVVEAYLKEAGMEVAIIDGIEPDPSVETYLLPASAEARLADSASTALNISVIFIYESFLMI